MADGDGAPDAVPDSAKEAFADAYGRDMTTTTDGTAVAPRGHAGRLDAR